MTDRIEDCAHCILKYLGAPHQVTPTNEGASDATLIVRMHVRFRRDELIEAIRFIHDNDLWPLELRPDHVDPSLELPG